MRKLNTLRLIVSSNEQLADLLTKSLKGPWTQFICSKIGAYDLCSSL